MRFRRCTCPWSVSLLLHRLCFALNRPALRHVAVQQEDFEAALDQGIRCSMENVQMRGRIAEEAAKRVKAQSELRSKIMAGGRAGGNTCAGVACRWWHAGCAE